MFALAVKANTIWVTSWGRATITIITTTTILTTLPSGHPLAYPIDLEMNNSLPAPGLYPRLRSVAVPGAARSDQMAPASSICDSAQNVPLNPLPLRSKYLPYTHSCLDCSFHNFLTFTFISYFFLSSPSSLLVCSFFSGTAITVGALVRRRYTLIRWALIPPGDGAICFILEYTTFYRPARATVL